MHRGPSSRSDTAKSPRSTSSTAEADHRTRPSSRATRVLLGGFPNTRPGKTMHPRSSSSEPREAGRAWRNFAVTRKHRGRRRRHCANRFRASGKPESGTHDLGGSGCLRSRLFSFATATTVGRGFTPVGAFKKGFEPQESSIRKSSPDTAARFRSCVEAPAISYLRRQERGSCQRSNFPTARSSAIPGPFWLGCASSLSRERR
jgi:hypothetical protein